MRWEEVKNWEVVWWGSVAVAVAVAAASSLERLVRWVNIRSFE
jgi:hypothetical protein